MNFTLGLFGFGVMGHTIAERLMHQHFPANQLFLHDVDHDKIDSFLQSGCKKLEINHWSTQVNVLILAVKPQSLADALRELSVAHQSSSCLLLSIVAGASLSTLTHPFNHSISIIRAMPNTPALVGKGVTALIGNHFVTPEQQQQASDIFTALGSVLWINKEDDMNAVTALSGSGPAYLFALIDAMEHAGSRLGLSTEHARQLACETGIGAMELLRTTQDSPEQLLKKVCSKGGTTEAALRELNDAQFSELIYRAMLAARERSREFS